MSEQSTTIDDNQLLRLTTTVVAAYLSHNAVPRTDLQILIQGVHNTLSGLPGGASDAGTPLKPAVPIKKSVTPDYVVCLEDGVKLKMLKRYLRSNFDMSPEDYRARWHLPANYPMVAPNYARLRSDFAKKIGLGRTPASAKRRKKA